MKAPVASIAFLVLLIAACKPHQKTVSALSEALEHANVSTRYGAARSLGEIGPPAKDATPKLKDALYDEDWRVRNNAALALHQIGPADKESAKEATSVLVELLNTDESNKVRGAAALALGSIGRGSAEVITALIESLRQDVHTQPLMVSPESADTTVDSIHNTACKALETIGTGAISALIEALQKHEKQEVRSAAAYVLGQIGPATDTVIPALINVVGDTNEASDIRKSAIDALAAIGVHDEDVVAALKKAIGDEDASVSAAATKALEVVEGRLFHYPRERGSSGVHWVN